ncbi:MAG: sulfite exporter TauE/SafE family protein [Pseudomonadota bacterium]
MTADLSSWAAFGLALAGAGLGAGFLGGIFGGGGGMIVIPVLYHVFGALGIDPAVRMHLVVGTSLAAVVPLSILGAHSHWRQGNVDPSLLKPLMPAALLGSLAAGFIGRSLDAHALAWLFAATVAITAWSLAMRPRPRLDLVNDREGMLARGAPTLGLVGASIGCVSTLVGIGGATLTVPVLHLMGARMRSAIGTSSTLGMAIALPGALSFAMAGAQAEHLPPGSVGYVNLVAAAMLFAFGSVGVAIGARLTKTVDETVLRRLFSVLLTASAVRMVLATA